MKQKKKLNNSVKKNHNKSFFGLLVIVLIILGYGFFNSISKKSQLKDSPLYTIGKITDKYQTSKRGYYIHYEYSVSGKLFERSQKLSIKQELIKKGDLFEVKYSSKNPDYSELLLDKRIKNE
ncbi:hypothetical protein [Aquimarina macrocephali]|uniref:hypothetical protein n=1 Tax=Aquimarina macrocephali TaxID=666563 RepID=UPI003F66CEC6